MKVRKLLCLVVVMLLAVFTWSQAQDNSVYVEVYHDVNDNGVVDGGESKSGMEGFDIQLTDGTTTWNGTTDSNGRVRFQGLTPNTTYTATLQSRLGWKITITSGQAPSLPWTIQLAAFELPRVTLFKDVSKWECNNLSNPKPSTKFGHQVKLSYKNNLYDVYFTYTTSDGTATAATGDYDSETDETGKIKADKDKGNANVTVYNDEYWEIDETYTVTLTAAWIDDGSDTDIPIDDDTAVGTIKNDDEIPDIHITPKEQYEDFAGNLRHVVTLYYAGTSDPGYQDYDVYFQFETSLYPVACQTANWNDNDFVPEDPSGLVKIAGHQTRVAQGKDDLYQGHAVVDMIADSKFELDELLHVELIDAYIASPTGNVAITIRNDGPVVGTILNDDNPPTACVKNAKNVEGDYGDQNELKFNVSLSNKSAFPTLVWFNVSDLTATFLVDYLKIFPVLVIPPEKNKGKFIVHINGDNNPEEDEQMLTQINAVCTMIPPFCGSQLGKFFDPSEALEVEIDEEGSQFEEKIIRNIFQNWICESGETNERCAEAVGTIIDDDGDYCCDFDSDRNVGLPPVVVNFQSRIKLQQPRKWILDFNVGSGGTTPCYAYYTQWMGAEGKPWEITLNGCDFENFIQVYAPGGLADLQVVDGSPTLKTYGWDNAIDGDIYGSDGMTVAQGEEAGVKPWAVFEFVDQSTRKVNKIRFMNDAAVCTYEFFSWKGYAPPGANPPIGPIGKAINNETRAKCAKGYADHFKVFVSTDMAKWTEILDSGDIGDTFTPCDLTDWYEWDVPATNAKYIKLELCTPPVDWAPWTIFSEFEVWFDTQLADAANSSMTVEGEDLAADGLDAATITLQVKDANGDPMEGLTDLDIKWFSKQVDADKRDENNCEGVEFSGLTETDPGVYEVLMTSTKKGWKTIFASINGVLVQKTKAVGFGLTVEENEDPIVNPTDCVDPAELVFVKGSETYQKPHEDLSWGNLVDGDPNTSVVARNEGDVRGPAWAIFQFCDGEAWTFEWVVFQTNNTGAPERDEVKMFEVWVSTTSSDMADFRLVKQFTRKGDGTEEWYGIGEVQAKYVMIKFIKPILRKFGSWRRAVEWRLESSSKDGPWKSDGTMDLVELPTNFRLEQNYPNPFNPVTTISFSLPAEGDVTLKVFDVQGKEVAELVNGHRDAGSYNVQWDASNVPSGIYFYRITAGEFSDTKRMTLMK